MRSLWCLALGLAWVGGACRGDGAKRERVLTVAAASSLTDALTAAAEVFEQQGGPRVVFSFHSSGKLAHQIEHGAPFDVFVSADVAYIDRLIERGVVVASSRGIIAFGRLALWSPTAGNEALMRAQGLSAWVGAVEGRLSIAHPDHAPYGRAAKQALEHAGLWSLLGPRIVYAASARQAMSYAQTGNVVAALVSRSLVVHETGSYGLVDAAAHDPLLTGIAVCTAATDPAAAGAFAAFLRAAEGRDILGRHGFDLPALP